MRCAGRLRNRVRFLTQFPSTLKGNALFGLDGWPQKWSHLAYPSQSAPFRSTAVYALCDVCKDALQRAVTQRARPLLYGCRAYNERNAAQRNERTFDNASTIFWNRNLSQMRLVRTSFRQMRERHYCSCQAARNSGPHDRPSVAPPALLPLAANHRHLAKRAAPASRYRFAASSDFFAAGETWASRWRQCHRAGPTRLPKLGPTRPLGKQSSSSTFSGKPFQQKTQKRLRFGAPFLGAFFGPRIGATLIKNHCTGPKFGSRKWSAFRGLEIWLLGVLGRSGNERGF